MPKKVLIIEDEADIRTLYSELLENAGYQVIQVGDGERGWEIINTGDWDLLLLDIMLPKQDGLEILGKIKSIPGLSSKPVLLITNLEKDSVVEKCLKLGANGYLVKSNIDPQQVLEAVEKHLPNV